MSEPSNTSQTASLTQEQTLQLLEALGETGIVNLDASIDALNAKARERVSEALGPEKDLASLRVCAFWCPDYILVPQTG